MSPSLGPDVSGDRSGPMAPIVAGGGWHRPQSPETPAVAAPFPPGATAGQLHPQVQAALAYLWKRADSYSDDARRLWDHDRDDAIWLSTIADELRTCAARLLKAATS